MSSDQVDAAMKIESQVLAENPTLDEDDIKITACENGLRAELTGSSENQPGDRRTGGGRR